MKTCRLKWSIQTYEFGATLNSRNVLLDICTVLDDNADSGLE